MDYEELVHETAAEMVRRHGPEALSLLRDYAEIAEGIDDALAAETWLDIATAADRIILTSRQASIPIAAE